MAAPAATPVEFISVSGVLLEDVVFASGETEFAQLGGAGVRAAVAARLLGATSGVTARTGSDWPSAHKETLKQAGITLETAAVSAFKHPRGWWLYDSEERASFAWRTASSDEAKNAFYSTATDLDRVFALPNYKAVRGVHVMATAAVAETQIAAIRRLWPSAIIVWEPVTLIPADDAKRVVSLVDAVAPSFADTLRAFPAEGKEGKVGEEAKRLCGALRAWGARTVALRLGAAGCAVLHGAADAPVITLVPAWNVTRVLHAVGASHYFAGAFLAALVQTTDPVRAAASAAAVASVAIESRTLPVVTPTLRAEVKRRYDSLFAHVSAAAALPPAPTVPPPTPESKIPLSIALQYGDGEYKADGEVKGPAAPLAAGVVITKPNLTITFLLQPGVTAFNLGRLQGPLKVVLGLLSAYIQYTTQKSTAKVDGRVVDTFEVKVWATADTQAEVRDAQARFVRRLPFDVSFIYPPLKATSDFADYDEDDFAFEGKGAHPGAERKRPARKLGGPAGAAGAAPGVSVPTTFRGRFELHPDLLLDDILTELSILGVFKPLVKGATGAILMNLVHPSARSFVQTLQKICSGIHSVIAQSDTRHVALTTRGVALDVLVDFMSKPLPDKKAATAATGTPTAATSTSTSSSTGATSSTTPTAAATGATSSSSAPAKTAVAVADKAESSKTFFQKGVELVGRYPALIAQSEFLSLITAVHLAAGYLGVVAFQRKLLYHPNEPRPKNDFRDFPDNHGMPYEECVLTCEDKQELYCWLIKQPRSVECPTVIYFHGNASNISTRLHEVERLYHSCKVNVLMLEYRGFGNNSGSPSQVGMEMDGRAALAHVRSRSDLLQGAYSVILFGRSIGGSVAIHTAAHHLKTDKKDETLAGVIVENTFTCIPDMVGALFSALVASDIVDTWDSMSLVPSLTCPFLCMSGRQDQLVPPFMMNALYDAATASRLRRFVAFPAGQHNDTVVHDGYFDAVRDFLNAAREPALKARAGGAGGAGGAAAGAAAGAAGAAAAAATGAATPTPAT